MFRHLRIGVLAVSCCVLGGCQSGFTARSRLAEHCQPAIVRAGEVRTGGELAQPSSFTLEPERALTLRQAILQSGGLKKVELSSRVPVAVQPVAQAQLAATSGDVAQGNQPARIDLVKELQPILGNETEMNRLLGTEGSGRRSAFNSSVAYFAPEDSDELAYLRTAVARAEAAALRSTNVSFDVSKIDQSSSDKLALLKMLQSLVEQSKANSPEFADKANTLFDKLSTALDPRAASVAKNASATDSNVRYVMSEPTDSREAVLLVGIENMRDDYLARHTVYFHPDLIFKTAVGDIPLQDGDFIFAVRADETSLPRKLAVQHELSSPVLGVSSDFNAIDPNDYSSIEQVFQLKRDAIREAGELSTIEDIGVLTRQYAGTLSRQSFYLPITSENAQYPSPALGTVTPGDSFRFVLASRSPFVLERLMNPIKEKMSIENKLQQQRDARLDALPAGGRFVSKVNSSWKFYTRPIAESARNLVK